MMKQFRLKLQHLVMVWMVKIACRNKGMVYTKLKNNPYAKCKYSNEKFKVLFVGSYNDIEFWVKNEESDSYQFVYAYESDAKVVKNSRPMRSWNEAIESILKFLGLYVEA